MSNQVTTAFVKQFNSNVIMLAQQEESVLRANVRQESQKGEAQFFERIGKVSAQLRTTRHGDSPILDTPHSRRMVTLKDYEWGDMVDSQDKVRMLIDPTSSYVKAAGMAFGRAYDQNIIAAALGNAYSGKDGTSTVALGNTQRVQAVASAAASNLNVQALRKASYLINKNSVNTRIKRYLALNASALENLLQSTEIGSYDYNSVKALVQGEVDTFMGFKFIRTEELVAPSVAFKFNTGTGLYDGSGTDTTLSSSISCIAWAEDGLLVSTGEDIVSRVSERADKGYNTYAYMKMSIGATRLEEEKVVEIVCKQS